MRLVGQSQNDCADSLCDAYHRELLCKEYKRRRGEMGEPAHSHAVVCCRVVMLHSAPTTFERRKMAWSRTRTGILGSRPNLVSVVSCMQASYTNSCSILALSIREIELKQKIQTFTETFSGSPPCRAAANLLLWL